MVIDHHGQRAPLLKQRGDAGVRFRTPAGGWLESARDCQSAAFLGHPSSCELSFTHIFLTLAMGKPCFSTLRHLATACDGRGGGAEPKTRGVAEKRDSALRVPGVNGQGGKKDTWLMNRPGDDLCHVSNTGPCHGPGDPRHRDLQQIPQLGRPHAVICARMALKLSGLKGQIMTAQGNALGK